MPAVEKFASLTMGWCLDCHRQPEKFLRPKSEITNMAWQPPKGQETFLGESLRREYDVHPRTSCSTCHR
jgi:hypothetical protein